MVNKGKAAAAAAQHEVITQMQPQNTSGATEKEIERSESKAHKTPASLSIRKKCLKSETVKPRRSSRLQSLFQPAKDVEVDTCVEHINLVESEMDDGTDIDEAEKELEPFAEEAEAIPEGKSLEDRVDELLGDVEVLKNKVNSGDFSSKGSSSLNYKGLYIYSQKKVDALTKENIQLQNQLQIAQLKIEAYDNMKDDVLDKLKDAIMVTNMSKATDAVVNLCNKVLDRFSVPSAADEPINTNVTRSPSRDERPRRGKKQDTIKN
ncbi:uncharacterized protein LOC108198888 isoform X1 [Daucus carota subsp. sativus]|uniref:uncharacterized protein LOC108198888 isoform X1 n=1 Tax=Daucus carota subsp. sativus TaxID=79200 RepID=UPI0007EF4CCD|nr:PREDICTED: uncharacterized protein LOC108198888 isoform X1 [Daucus carota subsp. sativus]